jgi:hypothetical protein
MEYSDFSEVTYGAGLWSVLRGFRVAKNAGFDR